jgi:hypothetical protein
MLIRRQPGICCTQHDLSQLAQSSAIWFRALLLGIASLSVLGVVENAAATSITDTFLFLEERVNAGATSGTSLQIEADISDPLFGVPGNILSVFATHILTHQTYNLPYRPVGNFTTLTFGPYFANPLYSSIPIASRTGQYNISVLNGQGQLTSKLTPTLAATIPLVHALNYQVSGPSLTPTISWSPVPGADKYELRIQDGTGARIWASGRQPAPTFIIPAGKLDPLQTYRIGIFIG